MRPQPHTRARPCRHTLDPAGASLYPLTRLRRAAVLWLARWTRTPTPSSHSTRSAPRRSSRSCTNSGEAALDDVICGWLGRTIGDRIWWSSVSAVRGPDLTPRLRHEVCAEPEGGWEERTTSGYTTRTSSLPRGWARAARARADM